MSEQPNSNAGKIRKAIRDSPSMTDLEIQSVVGKCAHSFNGTTGLANEFFSLLPVSYISQVRRKMKDAPAVEKLPVVILSTCLVADDREEHLEREAPNLPSGISWHKGMMYLDPIEGHECIVSEVAFDDKSGFIVSIEAMHVCPSKIDDDLKQMQENGWRVVLSTPLRRKP